MNLSLMYRGPLTSCNYSCQYCPFAKRQESDARLARDQESLVRFTTWAEAQSGHQLSILFTPWGEALVRAWYRETLVKLSHCDNVRTVAAQTNLSCGLDWIDRCGPTRLALWVTFHPTEVDRKLFVKRIQRLVAQGVRLSVGVVAVQGAVQFIAPLRAELPAEVYLWINAQQPRLHRYSSDEIAQFTAIDPQFPLTLQRMISKDRWCTAGETSFSVDGNGDMRRCHFVDDVIGNIYRPNWETALQPRRCPNQACHCFLGKSQLAADALGPFFGNDPLLRIPAIERSWEITPAS